MLLLESTGQRVPQGRPLPAAASRAYVGELLSTVLELPAAVQSDIAERRRC